MLGLSRRRCLDSPDRSVAAPGTNGLQCSENRQGRAKHSLSLAACQRARFTAAEFWTPVLVTGELGDVAKYCFYSASKFRGARVSDWGVLGQIEGVVIWFLAVKIEQDSDLPNRILP